MLIFCKHCGTAGMAQLLTHLLCKLEDPGSDPQAKPSLRVVDSEAGVPVIPVLGR